MLLAAVLRMGVPRPLTNATLQLPGATYYPDLWWQRERLIVEVDGGVHRRARRQAADRARDQHMRRHGLTVVRFTNAEVEQDAGRCAQTVPDIWHRQRTQTGEHRRGSGPAWSEPRRKTRHTDGETDTVAHPAANCVGKSAAQTEKSTQLAAAAAPPGRRAASPRPRRCLPP